MSGYNELKNAIRRVVKTNNNREITGQNLQSTLTSMVNSLGANYHFAGFASPGTNPGTPDQNIFYIASEEGTYVNFNGIILKSGLSFLMWNGKWSSETISVGEVTKSWVQQNYVSIAFFNELFELYNDSTKIAVNDTIPVDKTKLNIKAMFGFWTEQYISALGKNDSEGSGSGVDMATVWSALAGSTDEQINESHLTTALSGYATMSWVSQIFATITSIPTKLSQLANDTGFITSAALPTKVSQLVNDAEYVTASIVNGYATQSWVSQNYALKSDIPTKLSQLANDTGFITSSALPTKLSQLANDVGYITSSGSCASAGSLNYKSVVTSLSELDSAHWAGRLNAYTFDGFNTPILNNNGIIIDGGWDNANFGFQILIDDDPTYIIGLRQRNTNGWNNWKRIPMGDGTGASGTWDISISGNATAATKLHTARNIWGNTFDGTQDVNGDLILPNGKKIVIGTASLSWDADNNAVKIDGSVYATCGLSALGNSDTTGGGGGLMGSIVPYAKAITLTTQNEGEEIASAWSVKMLYDKIENVDVSGQLTSYLTKQEAQALYQPVGNYLTEHQDISGKADRSELSQYLPLSGGTLTGTLTANKGLVVQGRVYGSGDDEGIIINASNNGLAGVILGSHDSNRGILYFDVTSNLYFLRTVLNGVNEDVLIPHQSGTMALTSQIPTNNNQLTNGAGYITSSGSCAYATNADTVDGVHVLWTGSIPDSSWLAAWENATTIRCLAPKSLKLSRFDDDILSGKYLPLSGGDMTGPLTVRQYIFGYNYNHAGGNAPAFLFDKPGLNFTGIGANGEADTIYFSCATIGNDGEASWITSYKQKWKFNGTIYQEDNAVIHAGNIGSQSVNYAMSAGSVAWGNVSGRPTTLSGYGITDGLYNVQVEYEQSGVNISWLEDIIKTHRQSFVYNKSGSEYAYLIGMTRSDYANSVIPKYGTILKMGYADNYLRLLRRNNGAWLSNDWEKISAGFADSADKLQTARTIWGQRFDGTSNVDGNLACNGQGSFNSLQIGNITITYDAANNGLRIAGGGLYTDSYLSSLGVDASTALSVKKWADSINLTEDSDAELATAYSIGNLYRMINSNQKTITESLNQSVGALQGRCTSLEQRVSALENKVNK